MKQIIVRAHMVRNQDALRQFSRELKQQAWGEGAVRTMMPAIKFVAPLLGGVGGAAAGSALGPAGTVGGGALGYAGGNAIQRNIGGWAYKGMPNAPEEYRQENLGWKQQLKDAGTDALVGGALAAGGMALKPAVNIAGKALEQAGLGTGVRTLAQGVENAVGSAARGVGRGVGQATENLFGGATGQFPNLANVAGRGAAHATEHAVGHGAKDIAVEQLAHSTGLMPGQHAKASYNRALRIKQIIARDLSNK